MFRQRQEGDNAHEKFPHLPSSSQSGGYLSRRAVRAERALIPLRLEGVFDIFMIKRTLSFATVLALMHSSGHSMDQWVAVNVGLTTMTVNTLELDDAGRLYAGTAGGGVCRSDDFGESWQAINTGIDFPYIYQIVAITSETLIAGTNRIDGYFYGEGIYRSDNGGLSWTKTISGITSEAQAISIASLDDGSVIASLYFDYYKSSDSGISWTWIYDSYLAQVFNFFVASDGKVFAGTSQNLAEGGIHRSEDNGVTWELVYRTGPYPNGESIVFRLGEGVSPNILYAADTNNAPYGFWYEFSYSNFYRSLDGGDTWERLDAPTLAGEGCITAIVTRPQGDLFVSAGARVMRSVDNGESWENVSTGLPDLEFRDMIVAPNGTLFLATAGGGVYRSTWLVPATLAEFSAE